MKTILRITSKYFHFSSELKNDISKGNYKVIIGIIFLLLLVNKGIGQDTQGPLNWSERINVESNDVFFIWNNVEDDSSRVYQKVYRYKMDSLLLELDETEMVSKTINQEDSRVAINEDEFMDLALGRFNVDPYDDVVSIWTSPSGIEVMLPKFDSSAAMWTSSVQYTIEEEIEFGRVYVRTGNFDSDSTDEFIVSYLDSEDFIHIQLYDLDENMLPIFVSEIHDIDLNYGFSWANVNYFLESGDLNGDGTDEIIVQYKPNQVNLDWDFKVKVYDVIEDEIVPKVDQVIQPKPGSTIVSSVNMAIKSGQFTSDLKEELAFISVTRETVGNRAYVYVLELNDAMDSIIFSVDDRELRSLPPAISTYNTLSMDAGDLDNDGIDEIVFNAGSWILIHETEEDLSQVVRGQAGITEGGNNYDYKQSYKYLQIADVNSDNNKEIVIVKNRTSCDFCELGFYVAMLEVSNDLEDLQVIGRYIGDESSSAGFHNYALAFGNFDGYNFSIGEPTHYVATDIVQPIVILNAPPIHFDKFDDDIYDVNECYNEGECDFEARYTKQSTSSVEVSTTVGNDYSISAGISISGSTTVAPLGVGVSVNYDNHLLYNHGATFENNETNSTTVSVGVEVGAIEDDRIYSTISSYDIWEYPIYHGNETTPRNTILTFSPTSVEATWFPSKSYNAFGYIPDHEVSNILSYRPYPNLNDNPNIEQTIIADYTNDSFVLDANSDYNWFTSSTEFTSSAADTVKENGLDVGITYGPYRFEGDYSNKVMNTHTTTVTNLIQLDIHLGAVDMGVGDVKYTVTPYSYWANNGALVVDYAAKPEIAPPGSPETWWSEKYGSASDPTFILPWRLDPEKGFAISEEAKREQTKDIQFKPTIPLEGDTVDIIVNVRNFSLIPTPGSVSVSFYLGDPDDGGTPIIGIDGNSSVDTEGAIANGAKSEVVLKWAIPDDLESYPRIYAVLDEDDLITEVHANNNKGFNVLGATSSVPVAIEEYDADKQGFSLMQAYPNPFKTFTNIQYTLPKYAKTRVIVYDHMGREVESLLDQYQAAGDYAVPFNANGLESGVYYYKIQSGEITETKKLLLIK